MIRRVRSSRSGQTDRNFRRTSATVPTPRQSTTAVLSCNLYCFTHPNRKTEEGSEHPDRDAQFRHINAAVKRHLAQGLPVISVDTKKKELIGNYYNAGQQWLPATQPKHVQGHDFPTPAVPRAYPYGIFDLARNAGFVNVGTDHDTGAFAVASIRGWWRREGRRLYPHTDRLLITADGGWEQWVALAAVESGIAKAGG